MKVINKYKKIFILTSLIIAFYLFYFVFVLKKPFILDNDQWFQYNNFYEEWARLIDDFLHGRGLPFYSWNSYLGSDFYSSMGYYCTGNLFLPILLIFKNNIYFYSIIETILCIYIGTISMYAFLDNYEIKNNQIKIMVSILYSFGGTAVVFFGDYMFYRFYSFIPLALLGIIRYLKDKKLILFTTSILILFLQNYYLMWPFSLFIFVFCILEEINIKANIKKAFIDFLYLFASYMIGFMLSAVIVLPSILYILNNNRIGEVYNNSLFWPITTYLGILSNVTSINISGYMDTIASSLSDDGHVYSYNLMIGIIPFLSSVSYMLKKDNRHYFYSFVFFVLCIMFRPLCSMLHGFSNPSFRWLFILNIFILIISAKSLDAKRDYIIEKKIFFIYLFLIAILSISLFFIKEIDFSKLKVDIIIKGVSLVCSCLVVYIGSKKTRLSYILNVSFVLLSLCLMTYYQTKDSHFSENRIDTNVINYIEDIDEDRVFRYYSPYKNYDPGIFLQMNESLHYGFMSTSTYNSMVETKTDLFNRINGYDDWQIEIEDFDSLTMIGTKYLILSKNDKKINSYKLDFVTDINNFGLYKNPLFNGFIKTYPNIKYFSDFINTSDYKDTLFVEDSNVNIELYNNLKYSKATITEKGSNYIKGEIDTESKNIMLIPIPNNKGWKVMVNGFLVDAVDVNGGFMGVPINEGHNYFELYFIPKDLKLGIVVSSFGLIMMLLSIFVERNRKRETL